MPPLPDRPGAPEDPWIALGLIVLGGALALAALVWCVGLLAGLAFGEGPPGTELGEMPGVLGRLPGSLADPSAAWPVAFARPGSCVG